MKTEEFLEKLASTGEQTLYGEIPRYQHVERLGSKNVEGLLDTRPLVIQEKIDGANLTVAMGPEGEAICSRRQLLSARGIPPTGFRGAVEYVLAHKGITQLLQDKPNWILRGEWLVHHTLNYSAESWNKFYVFDIQDADNNMAYIPVWDYSETLNAYEILTVPLLKIYDIEDPHVGVEDLLSLADMQSPLGAEKREGVVIKNYNFVNKFGRTQWGKLVLAEFQEEHKSNGCTKKDPIETRFVVQCISDTLVEKTMAKIEDLHEAPFTAKNIGELLGRVWHDAFVEELWDFVNKNKVNNFDFHTARKLSDNKIRGIALAKLNGSN